MGQMAEIAYAPWKRIVVHEIREMEVTDFLQMVATQFEALKQGGVPVIHWAEGIAYVRADFTDTPEVVQEKLRGILHLAIVSFTRTSYQEQKKTTVGGREYVVKFVRVDDNPDLVNLCKFLGGFKGRDSVTATELKQSD
jgi:hypothetical protein